MSNYKKELQHETNQNSGKRYAKNTPNSVLLKFIDPQRDQKAFFVKQFRKKFCMFVNLSF